MRSVPHDPSPLTEELDSRGRDVRSVYHVNKMQEHQKALQHHIAKAEEHGLGNMHSWNEKAVAHMAAANLHHEAKYYHNKANDRVGSGRYEKRHATVADDASKAAQAKSKKGT